MEMKMKMKITEAEGCIKKLTITNKNEFQNEANSLLVLPTEVLEVIVGYVEDLTATSKRPLIYLRRTCKRMKVIIDNIVFREFEKNYKQSVQQTARNSATIRTLKIGTDIFVQYGFKSLFCGCLLIYRRGSDYYTFFSYKSDVDKFLAQFYRIIFSTLKTTAVNRQKWQLFHDFSVLNFLQSFDKLKVETNKLPNRWKVKMNLKDHFIDVERPRSFDCILKGAYFYYNYSKIDQFYRKTGAHRINLLLYLAKVLLEHIINISNCSCCCLCMNTNQSAYSNYEPSTTSVTFTIFGDADVLRIFETCSLFDEGIKPRWPKKFPTGKFNLTFDIQSYIFRYRLQHGLERNRCSITEKMLT